jgi:hypothetical protein
MPTNQTTTGRGYPLPLPSNLLAEDVLRLRDALQAIDNDITARPTSATVQGLVDAAVAALVDGSPAALDTLNELAAALGDDANFAATITTALGNRYTKAESDARFVQGAVQAEMVFTATPNQSAFTLSTPIINKPSALVTVDGVVQPTSEYSINQDGTTLTLSEGVPVGTIVRVLALGVASAGAPADDTVTTPKLRDGAVTSSKLGSNLTLAGVTTVGPIVEQMTISASAPAATQAYALTDKAVTFHTANATTNFTANFTGMSALAVGDAATEAILVTNGATAYFMNGIQVNGTTSGVTTRWQGGSAPTSGNANSIDSYSITIIKTGASTYTVLAAQTRF